MQLLFSAGIIVYFKKETSTEYLLLQSRTGYWGFAKGRIEAGESKAMAATRELYEEAAIRAEIEEGFEHTLSYFFRDKNGMSIKKTVYFFVGHASSQTVTISHEHANFCWLPYEQALSRVTYQTDREALIKAHHFVKERDQKLKI